MSESDEEKIMTVVMADPQEPLSQAAYDAARDVLDRLPAGMYIKCGRCGQWKVGGSCHYKYDPVKAAVVEAYCQGCGPKMLGQRPALGRSV